MWGRFILALCGIAALACASAAPSWAARTPSNDTSYGDNYSYAYHPALFGSREMYSSHTERFRAWNDMLSRTASEFSGSQRICATDRDTRCIPAEWQALINELRGQDIHTQIERVNQAMNRHPYVTTVANWHQSMYWETPYEFLRYGGQCQDYAIVKYYLLRAVGVPADQLRMVVLHHAARAVDHAVLAVYIDHGIKILDNLRSDIVSADSISYYRPYYSINENGWWYHVGGQSMIRVAGGYR